MESHIRFLLAYDECNERLCRSKRVDAGDIVSDDRLRMERLRSASTVKLVYINDNHQRGVVQRPGYDYEQVAGSPVHT